MQRNVSIFPRITTSPPNMTTLKGFNELPGKEPKKVKPAKSPEHKEFLRLKDNKRDNIPLILEKKGVKFATISRGELHINNGDETIRYWPGAGRWEVMKIGGRVGHTLQGLFEHLGLE